MNHAEPVLPMMTIPLNATVAERHHQQQHHQPIPDSPEVNAIIQQRIASARQLLRMGTESNSVHEAESILLKACELLESWVVDYEEHQVRRYYSGAYVPSSAVRQSPASQLPSMLPSTVANDNNNTTGPTEEENPFCTLLAQARHRYAQVCVLCGKLEMACRLFLQVLLHDPQTLSPSALSMAWYDVGLIYTRYGRLEHAMAALKKALIILHTTGAIDETMNFFIQQAMKQVLAHRHQQQHQLQSCDILQQQVPWSVQFTMTTYNYDDEDEDEDDVENDMAADDDDMTEYNNQRTTHEKILEEARRLIDPSVQHAGAA